MSLFICLFEFVVFFLFVLFVIFGNIFGGFVYFMGPLFLLCYLGLLFLQNLLHLFCCCLCSPFHVCIVYILYREKDYFRHVETRFIRTKNLS